MQSIIAMDSASIVTLKSYDTIDFADSAQPRMHTLVPRPFSHERVGSGDETTIRMDQN